jgi:hypothetical protein
MVGMNVFEALLYVAIGVPLYDWMVVTAGAGRMVSFDYVYWAPGRARLISTGLLAAGCFTTLILAHPPERDSHAWKLLPAFVAMVVHGGVACRDIFRQRRIALAEQA